ncbi:MAG: glutamate formimidoyltransferase [Deltaproteobacteria bacterium]|nr:glutamate formimidoyltransferase [Deltaproteobacteria bacterium]
MSQPLVECVPNFSEGRDRAVIDAITAAMRSVPGVTVLDVDPGADTNRTVFTFVAPPDAAVEAAFRAHKVAVERIDMSKHHGEHPRMGAADVTPFVPLQGVTMQDCVQLARRLGERVGKELGVPVYLYEEAATADYRRNLSEIRSGEYEGFAVKIKDPKWKPDFGPAEFNPKTGAFVIGAREFLVAYNASLNTRDTKLAMEIATKIRESGVLKKDEKGNKIIGPDGVPERIPGRFKQMKATGWYIDDYGRAQVSMNLTNYKVTSVHAALEGVRDEASKLGLVVTGSELVGLIPKDAMLEAGRYYLKKQGRSWGVPERELIHIAILSLGLGELSPFDPKKKIIEMCVEGAMKRLVDRTVTDFVDECSMDSPAPGGGSVAALSGGLGAALANMVANLTVGKKGYEGVWEEMKQVAAEAQALKDKFMAAIDRDTDAFNKVMDAFKLPKSTPEQKDARNAAIQEGTKQATLVPLEVLRMVPRGLAFALAVAERGNKNSASDAGVAALSLRTAAEGAWLNVRINLAGITDEAFKTEVRNEGLAILAKAREDADKVDQAVDKAIG